MIRFRGTLVFVLLLTLCAGRNRYMYKACNDRAYKDDLVLSARCLKSLRFNKKFRKSFTGEKLMLKLQKIEKRIIGRRKLKATDASLWSVVRRKLRVIVHRTVNTKKFSTELGSAICVFVHVSGEKYGFCTYIFLLIPDEDSIWHAFDQISAEEKAKLRAQKKMSMKLARKIIWGHENEEKRKEKGISQRVSGRSYSQYDRYWVKYLKELRRKIEEEKRIEEKSKQEEARRQAEAEEEDGKGKSRFIVVHLDFFKMRCDASEASSLCSEYCCDSQRWDTIFCNSKVKCY